MINFKEKSFKELFYLGSRHLIDCPNVNDYCPEQKTSPFHIYKKKKKKDKDILHTHSEIR